MFRVRRGSSQRSVVFRIATAIVRALVAYTVPLWVTAGPGALPVAAIGYTITDLGSLGGSRTIVSGMNNLGQVVGSSSTGPAGNAPMDGFLFDATGMHDLNMLLGGSKGSGSGINDAGQIVGSARFGSVLGTPWHAFLYDGSVHDLTPAATRSNSSATAVNARGHVAGWAATYYDEAAPRLAFFYDGTAVQNLGTLPGYFHSNPTGINASDQIVGVIGTDGFSQSHAFLWTKGVMQDLGTLGGTYSYADAINDAGQVVGSSTIVVNGPQHAFLYDSSGMHDLGTLGGQASFGGGINNLGQVVGTSDTPAGSYSPQHLFLYSKGVMQDLTPQLLFTPPWEWFRAWAINDRGQILIYATIGPNEHGYLLTPVPAPRLGFNSSTGAFGNQLVGTTSEPQTITLTNTGELPLAISGVSLTGANAASFAVASDTGETSLPPGASRTIKITFTPRAASSYAATLAIADNDRLAGSSHSVALSGTGVIPVISLSPPSSIDLGSRPVGTTSDEYHVGISNSGLAPLVIGSVTITGADAAEFAATDLSGVRLAPNEGRTISVRFTPTARGSRSATMAITSNAANNPVQVSLTGNGLAPVAQISPSRLTFGALPLGVVNDAQAVTIQNTGDAPLDIRGVSLTGADPADFNVGTDGWTGSHLLPGQIATLDLRFTPTAGGDRSAALVVNDNAAGGQQTINLSGTGTAPVASLSATSITFGDQPVGSAGAEQTVTLTNTGTAPLSLLTVSLSGANPGDFSAAADPGAASLVPGQSGTIRLRFHPSATGPRHASMLISDSAAGSPRTITLSGSGTTPSISFGISRLAGPDALTFGNQPLGTSSSPLALTLTNTGNAPLVIGGLTLGGAAAGDYQIVRDSGGSTLAPGAVRTITLAFTPQTPGSRAASLVVQDNAGAGQQTIGLTGNGTLPVAGHAGLVLPIGAELEVASINGAPLAVGSKAVVSVGQPVSLKLLIKFKDGATADVTADPGTRFTAISARGKVTAAGVWTPQLVDQGKTVTLTGSWLLPRSRKRWTSTVTVTVRAQRVRR